jgi:threonine/homoserine/homoserine lactone efflux protein
MDYLAHLSIFIALLAGIIIVPGMDMAFVLAAALANGRRAGVAATLGMMVGGAAHTLMATLAVAGLQAIIPAATMPLLVAGSLFMCWVGISLARSAITVGALSAAPPRRIATVFAQAVATCLMNPKAWMFTMATYPQFMKPEFGPYWLQGTVMGALTVSIQGLIYGGLALMAASARHGLQSRPSVTIWLGRSVGYMLVVIAAVTLWHTLSAWA